MSGKSPLSDHDLEILYKNLKVVLLLEEKEVIKVFLFFRSRKFLNMVLFLNLSSFEFCRN